MKKDLNYYRRLPYSRTMAWVDEDSGDGYWCVRIEELPGLIAAHTDRLRAVEMAKEMFDEYIEAHIAWGNEIPVPEERRFRRGYIAEIRSSESETSASERVVCA